MVAFNSKTRKICVFPTAQQKTLLKHWIGTVHWTYNQRQCAPTKKALRAHFMTEFGLREAERIKRTKSRVGGGGDDDDVGISWVFKTPHNLRDQAMGQFVTAYKNAVQAHGRGKFNIAFRSAKRLQQETVVIHSRDWNWT
ncbi:uncharacterized protein ACA1_194840 [Acanthamoeba castellanii str. Neff]|uniref:Transposase putative helix-turn-helix domain-containing protein n=1 Tax=Acanthamoeba castellanii (strain ATCC 30010 / Neff) TaxID=1257118 RepID=L8H598_ACACF|nr:uncharacterized protein ACA1_194840 [Acanthamoeba castellanii str. Neff]ELR20412.1 hypothetical protein ACA1_194840 [Acanthamoeba castellanii str. Neff]